MRSLRSETHYAALALLIALCSSAAAQTVIYDSGNTVPLGGILGPVALPSLNQTNTRLGSSVLPRAFDPFPVRTRSMRAAAVAPSSLTLSHPLPQPLVFIGCDPHSTAWLRDHAETLIRQAAAIQVIECPSLAEFQSLQSLAPDISMLPASGEGLAKSYGLKAYPLVIEANGALHQ